MQNKINLFIFYAECIITYLKLRKNESRSLSRPLQAFVEGQNAEGRTICLKFLAVLLVG